VGVPSGTLDEAGLATAVCCAVAELVGVGVGVAVTADVTASTGGGVDTCRGAEVTTAGGALAVRVSRMRKNKIAAAAKARTTMPASVARTTVSASDRPVTCCLLTAGGGKIGGNVGACTGGGGAKKGCGGSGVISAAPSMAFVCNVAGSEPSGVGT
jgi:hypothetical protein